MAKDGTFTACAPIRFYRFDYCILSKPSGDTPLFRFQLFHL